MGAIARHQDLSGLPAVSGWLRHADAAKVINDSRHHNTDQECVAALVRENVIAQLANLRTHPLVALALNQNRLRVHCWIYDIESGQIDAFDGSRGDFVVLQEHSDVVALGGRQKAS
jgi:carbonic anhydrase